MAAIQWSNAVPADSSAASLLDDDIRASIATMAAGFGTSFYGPGSAASQGASTASTGETRQGTARLARGSIRDGNSAYTGFLGLDTTRYGLYELSAATTNRCLGHSHALLYATAPSTVPFTKRWVQSDGSTTLSGAVVYNSAISFDTTFSDNPQVEMTLSLGSFVGALHTVSTTSFISTLSYVGAPGPSNVTVTVYWRAEGAVSY